MTGRRSHGRRSHYAPGTFSWVELATSDPASAKAFYGSVFGWESEEEDAYTVFRVGGDAVAGLSRRASQQDAAGAPPSWLSYVTVRAADEVAALAESLGGTVVERPRDVGQSGRMAVVRDPTGGVVALSQPGAHIGAQRVNAPGCTCWNDLVTPDPAAAEHFYSGLFGWRIEELAGGSGYRLITNEESSNGGMMPAALVGVEGPAYSLAYFNAGEMGETSRRIESSGGRLVAGPQEVPAGRLAVAGDPQGGGLRLVRRRRR